MSLLIKSRFSSSNRELGTAQHAMSLSQRLSVVVSKSRFSALWIRDARLGRLLRQSQSDSQHLPVLSRREDAIMDRVLVGAADKEIAAQLGISVGTVHSHFTNIFKKLGVSSRKDAARKFFGTEHLVFSTIRMRRCRQPVS